MNMCVFRKGVDVEDQSTVIMELEGGIKAVYLQCHYTPDYWRDYTFIGTEGRMENLDDESKVIVKTRDRSKRWKNLADQVYDIKQAAGEHGGADPLICKDFVDMVLDDKKPVATPLAGRMSVAVGCAATESIRKGLGMVVIRPVPANLKDRDF
jgi:predicted dehydrogenase